jgi:zipA, C-terminal ftsZ-binding domain
MTNPSVILLRIIATILVLAAMAGIALIIKRTRERERDRYDGHPKYRGSSLDHGAPMPDDGVTDFEAGGVEMRKTSRLNPGFFGGKNPPPPKPRGNPPEQLVPLAIMAPYGHPFSGKTVALLMKNFGLQYSPNRTYELLTGGGQEVFCTLLNIRKPPIFPPNLDSADVSYEGLLIVLQLPVSQEPVRDWETFIALVNEMSESCGGKLCDHNRRPLHERDLERLRKKIETYEGQYHAWLRG